MRTFHKTFRTAAIVAAISMFTQGTQDAHASLMLRLTDTGTLATVTVTDEGGGDLATGTAGIVAFAGSVGSFTVNVSTGTSKPLVGSTAWPTLNLDTTNVSSGGAGPLLIEVTDTGFGPSISPLTFSSAINSASSATSTVSYNAYIDAGNAPFATTTLITSILPVSGVFNVSSVANVATSPTYSLTLAVKVGGGVSQFDASLQAIPEPTAMMAWSGLALVGLIGFPRSSRR